METPHEPAAQPTGNCPCCRRRDTEPPLLICESCQTRLQFRLRDLGELHAQLGDPVDVDDDWTGAPVIDDNTRPVYKTVDDEGNRAKAGVRAPLHHHDPTSVIPVGPLKGRSGQPRVTGTGERTTPVDLQALDLDGHVVRLGGIPVPRHRPVDPRALVPLMRIVDGPVSIWIEGVLHQLPIRRREAVRNEHGRRIMVPAVDEIGPLPLSVRLDGHVRRWIDLRSQRENRPVPTVPVLLAWIGARLDWACQHDHELPSLDSDVRHMIAQVKGVLGLHDPEPQVMWGVPCRTCDAMNTLTRTPGDPYTECGGCGELLTDDEYDRWTGLLADRERQRLGRAGVKRALLPKNTPHSGGTAA